MSYRERDIKHEAPRGRHWVLDTGKAYAVMIVGGKYYDRVEECKPFAALPTLPSMGAL